ncbi:MAG: hypothetical protein ACRD2X_19720 [Vicinamibacteraceae bacterium]
MAKILNVFRWRATERNQDLDRELCLVDHEDHFLDAIAKVPP